MMSFGKTTLKSKTESLHTSDEDLHLVRQVRYLASPSAPQIRTSIGNYSLTASENGSTEFGYPVKNAPMIREDKANKESMPESIETCTHVSKSTKRIEYMGKSKRGGVEDERIIRRDSMI